MHAKAHIYRMTTPVLVDRYFRMMIQYKIMTSNARLLLLQLFNGFLKHNLGKPAPERQNHSGF